MGVYEINRKCIYIYTLSIVLCCAWLRLASERLCHSCFAKSTLKLQDSILVTLLLHFRDTFFILPPSFFSWIIIFFKNEALSLLYPYCTLTSCKELERTYEWSLRLTDRLTTNGQGLLLWTPSDKHKVLFEIVHSLANLAKILMKVLNLGKRWKENEKFKNVKQFFRS